MYKAIYAHKSAKNKTGKFIRMKASVRDELSEQLKTQNTFGHVLFSIKKLL